MPKIVPLTRGLFSVVDDSDYELVMNYSWHAIKGRSTFYAQTDLPSAGETHRRRPVLYLHRLILGVTDSRVLVDHIDGDGLNNRRSNLRVCTRSQNIANSVRRSDNRSGYKGVYKQAGKWRVQVQLKGVKKHVGYFSTPQEAHAAYCEAARSTHGEFAYNGEARKPTEYVPEEAANPGLISADQVAF